MERTKASCHAGAKVLLVGGDRGFIDLLTLQLRQAGLKAVRTCNADTAVQLVEAEQPSTAVVSLNLDAQPDQELLRELGRRLQTGVIVLGTSRAERDVALAFDLGAKDYLIPPLSFRELLARIHASLRRAKMGLRVEPPPTPPDRLLIAEHLILDRAARTATYGARPLRLTPTEYRILEQLLIHCGQVVRLHVLLRYGWGRYRVDEGGLVRVAMCRLRRKLRDAGAPELLQTRRGVGFVLRAERCAHR